jgi:hypothetical protein
MANLLLRSPQYKTGSTSGVASAKLTISIDSVLRYTIDYIEHSFTQTNPAETISINTTLTEYNAANGGGSVINTDINADTGFDGYGLFTGSVNPTLPSTTLQSNTDIYLPFNTASYIATNTLSTKAIISATDTSISLGIPSVTFTIHRVCDSKFGSSKITFLNRFGALQEMYFFHKSTEDITSTSESYKRNIFDYATSSYSSTDHQMQKFNTNATKKTTLNTPFVTEQFNEAIEELMLSEYVWLTQGSITHPVTPSTKSLRFKTSVNDKLVQYTIEFDHTSSVINNVR